MLHKRPPFSPNPGSEIGPRTVVFKTCLREVEISFDSEALIQKASTVTNEHYLLFGTEAYRFLLEVTCGLHSPIVGETEVFGQFKNLVDATDLDESVESHLFRKLFRSLITDTKQIRESYLKNFGSQSYGGLVRKLIRRGEGLNILGAGHLVEEMLPWLAKLASQTVIFNRTPERAHAMLERLKAKDGLFSSGVVEVQSLDPEKTVKGALIIAAPITASEISRWITDGKSQNRGISVVIDLRDTCQADPVSAPNADLFTLNQLFNDLEAQRANTARLVKQAQASIDALTIKRANSIEVRPLGWEDLCG